MVKQRGSTIEMVAGTLGVFALTECESFTWKHTIIGIVLALYVFQGMTRHKTRYESIVYCAVTSLIALLVVGKSLDWLRDNYLRDSVSRDTTHALVWVALLIIALIVHSRASRGEEVIHETN